jgi:hypothetical protein
MMSCSLMWIDWRYFSKDFLYGSYVLFGTPLRKRTESSLHNVIAPFL